MRLKIETLKKDIDAEYAEACEQLAHKVDLLWRTRKAVLENPGAPRGLKDLLRQAGSALARVMEDRGGYMNQRRKQGMLLQGQRDQIDTLKQRVAGHRYDVQVRERQKGLRQLQGEALRPDDLVLAPGSGDDDG